MFSKAVNDLDTCVFAVSMTRSTKQKKSRLEKVNYKNNCEYKTQGQ